MRRALYPGTFDPIHHGHLDIAQRALRLFDELVIGIYDRPNKSLLFNVDERVALAHTAVAELEGGERVRVTVYHGLTVDFARKSGAKTMPGLTAACKGRPVSAEQIEQLGEAIEEYARLQGPEIPSAEIGLEVLDRLRGLDEVAYLRFASVYKGFDAAADFQRELVLLKKLQRS